MTRYAMVVDLRRCVGCQTCTAACKHTNATPPGLQWRWVLGVEAGEECVGEGGGVAGLGSGAAVDLQDVHVLVLWLGDGMNSSVLEARDCIKPPRST